MKQVTGGSSPSASAGVGGFQKDNLRASRDDEHYSVQGCPPARYGEFVGQSRRLAVCLTERQEAGAQISCRSHCIGAVHVVLGIGEAEGSQ